MSWSASTWPDPLATPSVAQTFPPSDPAAELASAVPGVEEAPPRVLVVDDDQGFREMLRDFLIDDGFDVVGEASDGEEAVTLTEQLLPEVVLMDLRMPRMDGIEATRVIKAARPTIQVIILSAYEDPGLKRGAEEVGVYCYLIKGCPPSIIRDMLRFARDFKTGLDDQAGRPSTPAATDAG
jgi:NarL family two-component system response regulator LiaR